MSSHTGSLRNLLVTSLWVALLPACGEDAYDEVLQNGGDSETSSPGAAGGPEEGDDVLARAGTSGAGPGASGQSPTGSEGHGLSSGGSTFDGSFSGGSASGGSLGAWVFDDDHLRTYELAVDPVVWADLEQNALEEEYVPADLRVDGTELPGIGVRYKGSWGTLNGCFDESGARICSKLSVKLDFSEYEADQRLDGLKRLNFHSMIADPSHMHERLGYRLFREMGLAAPRAVHARLVVNGEDLGVFSLVENVDGRFTADRFTEGDGNLYKEMWPRAASATALDAALETNEDAPDHSGLTGFYAELSGADSDDLVSALERHMDIDELLAYLAVDRAMNNWDGVTAFYCYEEPCTNHNFFLYQQEREPRFTLIPWDIDKTFELTSPFEDAPGVLDIPADCSARFHAGPPMMPPACDRIFAALSRSDRARYVAQLDRLLEGPFRLEPMQSAIDRWQAQLESAVASDAHGPGIEAFRAAVQRLREDLPELRARLSIERDANR